MAWATPPTVTTGQLVTAANWNTLANDLLETAPAKVTTQGDIVYGTAANAIARLAAAAADGALLQQASGIPAWLAKGTALQGLRMNAGATASEWADMARTIYKAADETVNNSTTLQNDDSLVLPVAANEVWYFQMNVLYTSSGAADFKIGWTIPAAGALRWHAIYRNTAATDVVWAGGLETDVLSIAGTSALAVMVFATYKGGANAGDVQLQWAQNTAEVSDTKVLAGSAMIVTRLA